MTGCLGEKEHTQHAQQFKVEHLSLQVDYTQRQHLSMILTAIEERTTFA